MKEKLQKLHQYVQQYSQYGIDGLRELSNHPVQHSSKALKDLVKDYWDAGIAVGSGLAYTQYGDNLYGDYQLHVAFFGPFISAIGAEIRDNGGIRELLKDRFNTEGYSLGRNFYAGLSTILISWDIYPKSFTLFPMNFDEVFHKFFDAFSLTGFIFLDYKRREQFIGKPQNIIKTLEESL